MCLTKITYTVLVFGKIKLLKYKMINFNNFILPRPRNLYVILVRHNGLPEDGILNVETCRSMLFVIVFDIVVQSSVKFLNNKECTVLV